MNTKHNTVERVGADQNLRVAQSLSTDRKSPEDSTPLHTKRVSTFKIAPECQLEKVAANPNQCRRQIENIRVEYSELLKRNVAVATNGRAMAVVPVDIPEDSKAKVEHCLISPKALKAARKNKPLQGLFDVNGQINIPGAMSFPRPTESECGNYVNWDRCLIGDREEVKATLLFNPQFLLDLAKAIGWNRAAGIKVEFFGKDCPLKITASDSPNAFGLLMPTREI